MLIDSTPEVGGLLSAQALDILRGTGDLNSSRPTWLKWRRCTITPISRRYHADITGIVVATIAHDYLVLMAQKKV